MASDDLRLVIPTNFGQLTAALVTTRYVTGDETVLYIEIDDDSATDSEQVSSYTSRSPLSLDQVRELREFLDRVLTRPT